MRSLLSRLTAVLAVMVMSIATAGCKADEQYVLVSHAPDSDSWWNTVKNAIKHAGEDFNVKVDYRNPPNGDLADMARLIEQAAAHNYSGVATSIADFSVLQGPIKQVGAKRIPIVSINSGTSKQSQELGALMHIGQPEYESGKAAGERAKSAGIKSFVCVNHYATNVASFDRCRGFADALGVDFKSSMLDSGTDPTTVTSKVSAYMRNNPDTQAVLALGPNSAEPTLQALEKMGLAGKVYFGTFDVSPAILQGIKKGQINFAIDQQPYLQGYIAVAVLAIAHKSKTTDIQKITAELKANPKFQARLKEYGLQPVYGARDISSGPSFVTQENSAFVEKYAGQYR
jgi:simple sugar transport system substrate-binding protein